MTLDLEGEVRRCRLPDGRYAAPEPAPHHKPDCHKPLADALAAALAEPPDQSHAVEAALHLIETFPGCRVGRDAFALGLADIVADDAIPPAVVRHVCRRARAKARALPTLADLRDRMLAEMRARRDLLARLEFFPRRLAEARKRDAEEAARITTTAARHGATLEPSDLVAAWHGITEGWLHQRINLPAMHAGEDFEGADVLMATLDFARPREAFEAAIRLLPDLAAYCREREAAVATAPALGTPEGDAWDRQWPAPETKFADRIASIVAAFKQAHKL
jgi:hypothetical protein